MFRRVIQNVLVQHLEQAIRLHRRIVLEINVSLSEKTFMHQCVEFLVKNMSAGRQEAFDHFRRDNPLNQKLEEHKRILKQRYTEAKSLGEEVNQSRNRISNELLFLFQS